jgi:hypothetical protein
MPQNTQSAQIVKPYFDGLESTRPASNFSFSFFLPSLQCTCAKMFGQEFRAGLETWHSELRPPRTQNKSSPNDSQGTARFEFRFENFQSPAPAKDTFHVPMHPLSLPLPFLKLTVAGNYRILICLSPQKIYDNQLKNKLCGWGAVEAHVLLLGNMTRDYHYYYW